MKIERIQRDDGDVVIISGLERDEPVFPIRARDAIALDAVAGYMHLCLTMFKDVRKAGYVFQAYAEMKAWRDANENSIKVPTHPHVPVKEQMK